MADTSTAAEGAAPAVKPLEFSNANLVKFMTHDNYSTAAQVKKTVGKCVPPAPGAAEGTPEAISAALKGLVRAGKNPKKPTIFFAFETAADRDAAVALIVGTVKTRGKPWSVEEVTERDMDLTHKAGKKERSGAKVEGVEEGPGVAPWMNIPYGDQLRRKSAHCVGILKTINKQSCIRDGSLRTGAMLSEVVQSPQRVAYRNNVLFTCGLDESGVPCVGFQAGQSVAGKANVLPADGVPTAHPLALAVRDTFMAEVFAPNAEALPMYRKAEQTGFWRKLHVRHNKEAEVMLDIEVNPTGVTDDAMAAIKQTLATWAAGFAASVPAAEWELADDTAADLTGAVSMQGELPPATVTSKFVSLQWHSYTGMSTAPTDTPRETIFGGDALTQTLFGLKFDISPGAFFQVNRLGCERLLSKVADEAQLDSSKTILLDLCCGTGTIGLCLSSRVQKVIGVEMVAAAIDNAKVNAERNGVTNAEFVCGRVEHALRDVLTQLPKEADVVAILDPPRCGVHADVLRWLRNCRTVRRIVYISCDQRALETDCAPLCKASSRQHHELPFRVCGSFGVDLFPQTPHVEMVVTLRRVTLEEIETYNSDNQTRREREVAPAAAATDAGAAPADEAQRVPPQPSAEQV